ncbi:hypothetical protein EZV62_000982 [Acer yangbiense]|uniref:Amine oxidase domain-containing protein n=1 Tax=Acer yangbiense TaxID=1000413 RepID=A0A5C7ISM1_9ROSI|nr:hypothetical protein EZV62_000982 [Acer yangbiense]
MRVAVVGGGISGLVSVYVLAKSGVEVVLYEKEDCLGGHAKTVTFHGFHFDLGFMVFNRVKMVLRQAVEEDSHVHRKLLLGPPEILAHRRRLSYDESLEFLGVTYPNMVEFFESLGVEMETSDMSFSVSLDKGYGCEWGSRNGLSSLFAQKKNAVNPYFWQMLREIIKFKKDVISYLEMLEHNPDIDRSETLGHFITSRGYSELFQKAYIIPVCGSIWSCPSEGVMSFSAFCVLSFFRNHHLLQVSSVLTVEEGCTVVCGDVSEELYNGCIMAVHAPDALKMLGSQATFDEMRILGAFQYVYSDIFLHCDKDFLPQNPAAWSAWNFLGSTDNKVCLTYWLNVLQNIGETSLPYLVTLNPDHTPENTLIKWSTAHPVPSVAASKASLELDHIQGKRGIWFCGAYQGYGFHEDGLKSGLIAAHSLLGKHCAILSNPRHMVPSLMETGARLFVARFLGHFISLIFLEEGGTVFTFEGSKNCQMKSILRVQDPQFYWKVMTEGDLGLADSYINGDFSFVDKDEGLLNLIMILIGNRDLDSSVSKLKQRRGWWSPLFFTAGIASAKYFFRHTSRQNTPTQARRNISSHYDLSTEDEDLNVAQMRKVSLLIEKAKIREKDEVLEIGCGWGALAIEVVKRTGCKYTGITLSEEQLKYTEMKVKEAGVQDHIRLYLYDYRQLPKANKYDRIISCEMIEAVGHEYMEEFFGCCESLLAKDGLLVLQLRVCDPFKFSSMPDERYEKYRQSSDFIKEYIFPGACVPSLSRITTAMASASRLSKILALGFDEKFVRTWEYYFDYCAAGFKTHTLGNYQMAFSRPGNVAAFTDPYKGFPSTDSVM